MKQKFRKLSFVHVKVDKVKTPEMSHFDSGFDAIIEGSYSQLYGGRNTSAYSVYKLKDGKIVNKIAWFEEEQLSLLPKQNKDLAENMIEEYNLGDDCDSPTAPIPVCGSADADEVPNSGLSRQQAPDQPPIAIDGNVNNDGARP